MGRAYFVFSDSLHGCLFAGDGEGAINANSLAGLAETLPHRLFAGIVCVAV